MNIIYNLASLIITYNLGLYHILCLVFTLSSLAITKSNCTTAPSKPNLQNQSKVWDTYWEDLLDIVFRSFLKTKQKWAFAHF